MGQVKKLMMDFEELYSTIDTLIHFYSDKSIDDSSNSQTLRDLFEIQELIRKIDSSSIDSIYFVMGLFSDDFQDAYSELYKRMSSDDLDRNLIINMNLDLILRHHIRRIRISLSNYITSNQSIYNSENYYYDQIKNLENQKLELQNYLEKQKNIVVKSKDELEKQKREVIEKEMSLIKANEQIRNFQKELEEKKKQENAIVEWDSKIKLTFNELKTFLSPIKNEHFRMNIMFWIYVSLISLTIIAFAFLEITVLIKLNKIDGFPELEGYIASVIPIPILGALLWVFIIQLNRTQRQLVILAKHIHEIEYVEGLLLSVNSLSPDITNSTNRVNLAIDKLLDNHLNASSSTGVINEDNLINEEKKDMVPYDVLIKLLHEIKGFVGK